MNRKIAEAYVGVTTNQFAYDGAGDLLKLTDGKGDITTWTYDIFGLVSNKVDAAGNLLFIYHYDADNRLINRWSAAKGSTAYSYDAMGNLTYVDYPVSPDITLKYDVLNRLTNMVDAMGTTVYGYDAVGQLLSEDGPWGNDTVSFTYHNRLRTGLSLQQPGIAPWTNGYAYDSIRRLSDVTSPAGEFDYTYDPIEQQRVDRLTLPNAAFIKNTYDNVARLIGTYLQNGTNAVFDSYDYGYNQANQRTNVTRLEGDSVTYTYDNMGELTTATGKEPDGVTPRLQEQLAYVYDAAGNLNVRTNNALVQSFTVNNLNELSTTASAGQLTVAGTTTTPATNVTVNGSVANRYVDATFALDGFTPADGINSFTAVGWDGQGNISTNTVTVNLSATNDYTYDLNGNLLSDGTRNFAYDDENQLICAWVANTWSNNFVYDGKMRRRILKDFQWDAGSSSWVQTNEIHFIYDGNLVVQERGTNNLPQVTYTRGNDLSGTLQSAGGIGGLLARTDTNSSAFYHADGSRNITMLLNSSQMIVAKYLYDPYGNMLAMSGPLADANTYRFSSKEWNQNSGLYYYLYRFYDPSTQRWLNRDPLGEVGFESIRMLLKKNTGLLGFFRAMAGVNLYEYADNGPVDDIDTDGLWVSRYPEPIRAPIGMLGSALANLLGTLFINHCPDFTCTKSGCQACCAAGLAVATAANIAATAIGCAGTLSIGCWLNIAAGAIAQAGLLDSYAGCVNACSSKK